MHLDNNVYKGLGGAFHMLHIIAGATFLFISWRFGDWKNWTKYYPTILFFIIGDLLYNVLTYNNPTWSYNKDRLFPNHTLINIWIMITIYPATAITYLSHFPKEKIQQILYILLWTMIYVFGELLGLHIFGLINHFNGWNMWWSALFDIILFTMLPIHHKRPLVAWSLSIIVIIFFLTVFNVKISALK